MDQPFPSQWSTKMREIGRSGARQAPHPYTANFSRNVRTAAAVHSSGVGRTHPNHTLDGEGNGGNQNKDENLQDGVIKIKLNQTKKIKNEGDGKGMTRKKKSRKMDESEMQPN